MGNQKKQKTERERQHERVSKDKTFEKEDKCSSFDRGNVWMLGQARCKKQKLFTWLNSGNEDFF